MTREGINEQIDRRVAEALEARNAARNLEALAKGGDVQENVNGNRGVNGNGNGGVNVNGNGGVNGNGRGNKMEMVMGTEEEMAITLEQLSTKVPGEVCYMYPAEVDDRSVLSEKRNSEDRDRVVELDCQNMEKEYTAGNNERKGYVGSLLYCNECRLHHEGPCIVKYGNCKRVGHMARDYTATAAPNTQRAPVGNQSAITGGNEATTRAYAIEGGGANPDSNVITGTFLLNNYYASMLFDSSADRSFVSSTFSALLDVVPSTLDTSYAIELADGRILETNVFLRGCTLGLLGHPVNIDLMPVELGSFDIIIDMDWLVKYQTLIVCDEKVVCIPYGDEVLII
ncbi:putative reverse transcriptase domain-containing protein [Tanacetum coccineum]